ncbi:helix-turn-helix transcriptional regulator [Nitrospirillum sp. BR 11164]|uniref:helix-turn-helix domain-containing protein n=1 Tax=Nitrospirillum sp. BR 11164 TaxID=3104324 RepID=UPI002AFE3946|nr:helix-turn-helix transcriptional regulator [Nitrospirillum sp. BR 11164]MEA1648793.1 helix-turn-helix transcriptional regulator [Nitrospirillum sp. BR 11164]
MAESADSVTIRRSDYEALLDLLTDAGDLVDANAITAKLVLGETEAFPEEVLDRLTEGTHPVTVFREHRDLSIQELALRAGVGRTYISEIERGLKPGSLSAMARIAAALSVSLDLLVPLRK